MKYSIILPVRNGGEYVKACVASILAQTYTGFNFIILDNCSNDGTLEWLQTIDDTRIQIITSSHPLTIEESWRRVIGIKKNEFITLIGHDDILYPDFLHTIDELITKNPMGSLFLTHFELIDDMGEIIRPCKPMHTTYTGDALLKEILINGMDLMGTGYVMRAKDYDRMGGIPTAYPSLLYADFELWVNFAALSFMSVSPANCFAFRMHQSTAHASKDSKLHRAMNLFIQYLAGLKLSSVPMEAVINQYATVFLVFFCRGFSHRLLRVSIDDREGMTVDKMITQTRVWAKMIGVEAKFHPEKVFSIRIAKIVDRNIILRRIFLLLKKIYPKSIIKK